jgi:hypothetical protein
MHWREFLFHLQQWWFRITFPVGGVLGLWGLAKMYEWIMERTVDQEVKKYLQGSVGDEYKPIHGFPVRDAIPRSISEISIDAKVTEWRLKGCLRRLERKDMVVRDGEGWKIVQR